MMDGFASMTLNLGKRGSFTRDTTAQLTPSATRPMVNWQPVEVKTVPFDYGRLGREESTVFGCEWTRMNKCINRQDYNVIVEGQRVCV
jgi:hypothetical protein